MGSLVVLPDKDNKATDGAEKPQEGKSHKVSQAELAQLWDDYVSKYEKLASRMEKKNIAIEMLDDVIDASEKLLRKIS